MLNSAKIAIIGPGRVGLTIATLAKLHGLKVVAIGGRNQKRCEEAVTFIDSFIGTTDHKNVSHRSYFSLFASGDGFFDCS